MAHPIGTPAASGATRPDHDVPDGDHHDSPDEHDPAEDHGPAEDPRWVLIPLIVGLAIGLLLAIVLGTGSGASVL